MPRLLRNTESYSPLPGSRDDVAHFPDSMGMIQGAAAKGDGPQLSLGIPENISSTETLAIGGSRTGSIDFVGDGDFYRVTLIAGQSYAFTMTGQGGAPLPDTFLELYNANGNLLALDDDAGPNTDSLLRFTATESGTYFINARGYEEAGVSNTGGYTVSAALGPPQNPLDSINLGFTVSQQNITVYFAAAGESNPFNDVAIRNWTQTEINAVFAAFATFEALTNLSFTQVGSAAGARFVLELADLDPGVLGYFGTTGGVGYGAFDPLGSGWSNGLFAGGLGFATLIHEIGHGLGLAHPHDNGGTSEVMQGVISEFDSYGTYGLNQGVFTMMSYNDGYPLQVGGSPRTTTYGSQSTPMPLDIALLQQKYGADPNTNSGNTTYALPDGTGTSYIGIWDTSGIDEIVYGGAHNATIDLRAATLLNAVGGGGYVSFAGAGVIFTSIGGMGNILPMPLSPVAGGFVIAAGVVIEGASGGSGADTITGNAADNTLRGNGGDDTLIDGSGNDTLDGGDGFDVADYTLATGAITANLADTGPQNTGGAGSDTFISIEAVRGSTFVDFLTGNGGDNLLDGGAGADTMAGGPGDDIYVVDSANDLVVEGSGLGNDTIRTTLSIFNLGPSIENLTYVGAGNFIGVGGSNPGTLIGGAGNDTLIGSQAGGALNGGDGNDVLWFYGSTALEGGTGFDHSIQLDQSAQVRSIGPVGVEVYVGNLGNDTLDSVGATAFTVIYGGAGDDAITQSAVGGFEFGQDGNDALTGGAGADTLIGNAGADTFAGNDGNDVMYIDDADGQNFDGGAGADYAIVEGAAAVNINLVTRNVEVFIGNVGNDTINAGGVVFPQGLYGFGGDDIITGGDASSQLFGQDGNDVINAGALHDVGLGGAGDDQLFGAAGNDLLIGEAGNDLLVGGTGADILWGDGTGVGTDTFRFATSDVQAGVRDQINDFGDGAGNEDVIQFSGIAQNQVTVANDGGGNALLTIATSGGTYSILVIGMTAAAIADDLVFGP